MTPAELARALTDAARRTARDGELDLDPARLPEPVVDSPPRPGGGPDGDYASGFPLRVARLAGRRPDQVAASLAVRLRATPGLAEVTVTGPGFVTVTLQPSARAALVRELADRPVPGLRTVDQPARDLAAWAAVTGEPAGRLVRRTEDSSLFRVQYAHFLCHATLRWARDLRVGADRADGSHRHPAQRALLGLLADQSRVASAGRADRHARHLDRIAGALRTVVETCPPLPRGGEKPGAAHRERLALVEATGTVLAGGLTQLGVTAPHRL
ncbi:DALR anticodon-binding domain-containing protein [Streptomyces sp. NPDC005438]|uniref:DALR anticodon-binding domain-containing protein n=1 Tax=Streptomyces sp. NPDC005438 TaxID=3156880 RepID=UPI0033AAEB0F